jgi:hypothetical protein
LDGIDTLLLQLLCDVGDAAGVEALLCGVHAAVPGAAAAALRGAGRWHGLALLQMNGGHPRDALMTWQVRLQMRRRNPGTVWSVCNTSYAEYNALLLMPIRALMHFQVSACVGGWQRAS